MQVIAEIGSNWAFAGGGYGAKDPFDACVSHIADAKDSGADIVKFQLFSADTLYSKSAMPGQYKAVSRLEFDVGLLGKIRNVCAVYGVELWVSLFSGCFLTDDVLSNVDGIKVASGDCVDIDFVSTVSEAARAYDITMCMSTGGATLDEMKAVSESVLFPDKFVVMYAVPMYPPRNYDIRVSRGMLDVMEAFGGKPHSYGYSDHSDGEVSAIIAAGFGATYIERHFMSRGVSAFSPDYGVSLLPDAFRSYSNAVRNAALMSIQGDVPVSVRDETMYIRRGSDGLRPSDEVRGE